MLGVFMYTQLFYQCLSMYTCKDMLALSLMLTASIVRRLHNCVSCLHKGGLQVSVVSSHGNVIRTACGVDYQ